MLILSPEEEAEREKKYIKRKQKQFKTDFRNLQKKHRKENAEFIEKLLDEKLD